MDLFVVQTLLTKTGRVLRFNPKIELSHQHPIKGQGQHTVLQRCQLLNPASWKDVRMGGEKLSQLDECRSQLKWFSSEPSD